MDFTTKELLKRYAKLAIGQPFSPVLLNILVTSVCDMRCTHCFFTDELDDRPRKKLQMKTRLAAGHETVAPADHCLIVIFKEFLARSTSRP